MGETGHGGNIGGAAFLQHHNCARRHPAACQRAFDGTLAQTFAIGRVDEDQIIGRIAVFAQPGGIAAKQAGRADGAQRVGVGADEGAGLRTLVHKQHMRGTPAQCFKPQRAGACKQVKHARTFQRRIIAMRQQVEQAFARAVRCRAQMRRRIARAKAGQCRALVLAADNAHQPASRVFRFTPASATRAASGDLPASISRLPTI